MKAVKLNPSNLSSAVTLLLALTVIAMFILSGCSNNPVTNSTTGTGTGSEDNMSVSVMSSDNLGDNAGLEITEAKGLLTEIEVESDSSSKSIKVGPIVVQLNVAGLMKAMTSGIIPAGNYKKIKFQLHKPEDTETIPDPDFREGSSGNKRYSFIVKGNYNSAPFVYKSKKTINIVINLNSTLTHSSKSNITVLFDKTKWFLSGSNTLDPSSGSNENEIDDNIKGSFKKAFRDDDKNGVPDDN